MATSSQLFFLYLLEYTIYIGITVCDNKLMDIWADIGEE